MQFRMIISLVFAIIIAIFAIMNSGAVTIHLFLWKLENVSLAMVILASAIFGAVLVYLSGTVSTLKRKKQIKNLEQEIKKVNSEAQAKESGLDKLKMQIDVEKKELEKQKKDFEKQKEDFKKQQSSVSDKNS